MNFTPLVNIIMPVYNCEKYISSAIESVLKQSYTNWELLVIDDGSTDQSPMIADNYSRRYPDSIKVYHQQNSGVSNARNFALSKVHGDFVTFIDSDDLYHPDRLSTMLRFFEQYPESDIIFARHIHFTGEEPNFLNVETQSATFNVIKNSILETVISDSSNHFVWNCMMKSSIAKSAFFPSIRFAEDFCFIRECAAHCRQVIISDHKLYFYRRDNMNAMTQHFFDSKYIDDYKILPNIAYEFVKKNHLTSSFYTTMVAHEYAQAIMRIRKCTSFPSFVRFMNDSAFRKGLTFFTNTNCSLFEKMLLFLVKHKFYIPFFFWVW